MPKATDLQVLVVDDQQSMRGLTRYALQNLGVKTIVEARNGREALERVEAGGINLIISDWNMEEVDGLTLLKVLRQHPKTQRLPFIMATGQSDKDQVKAAISAGVNNYIIKPFDVATLKKKIEAVVGQLS